MTPTTPIETLHDALQPLRAREAQVLPLLLVGKTVNEISAAIGISRQTVWRIRTRPAFATALQAARGELLAAVVDRLRSDASGFADVLHKVANDEKQPGSHRVAAAREGLGAMFKGIEQVDFEERLRALEGVAGGRK